MKHEDILERNCPSMSNLYLDDQGRAFRARILKAMEEACAIERNNASVDLQNIQTLINQLESDLFHERANGEIAESDIKGFMRWVLKTKMRTEFTEPYLDQLYNNYKRGAAHAPVEVCVCTEPSQFDGTCSHCGKTILPF